MTDVALIPAQDAAIADRIREEVSRQLEKSKQDRKSWAEHPLLLLIVGFLLTTGAGSLLSSWWQYEQWARQQHYRAAQDLTKERVAVMTLAAQSIAQSFTAAEDVLQLSAWEWRQGSDVAVLKERASNWTAESRKWRTTEKVVVARVAAAYPDQETGGFLDGIITARKQLGNDITNLLALEDQKHRTNADQKEIADTSRHALGLVNSVTGRGGALRQLIAHMVGETRKGDQLPPPQSFWRWLFTS